MPLDTKTILFIKRLLSLPKAANLPRCPARSQPKALRLKAAGDDQHFGPGHVCSLCRCNHTAGWGTKGDFYNIGRPDVGHFGCGFCKDHERGVRSSFAQQFAINHMKALQQFGMDKHPSQDFKNIAIEEANEASARNQIRKGMQVVQETLLDFQNKLKGFTPEGILKLVGELEDIRIQLGAISKMETLDGDNFRTITKLLEEKIEEAIWRNLKVTAASKGSAYPATDADVIPLACELARTISKLSVDTYKLEESDYIHVDEVKIRIPRMISLFERYCVSEDQRKDFLQGLRDIWTDVKTGAR